MVDSQEFMTKVNKNYTDITVDDLKHAFTIEFGPKTSHMSITNVENRYDCTVYVRNEKGANCNVWFLDSLVLCDQDDSTIIVSNWLLGGERVLH